MKALPAETDLYSWYTAPEEIKTLLLAAVDTWEKPTQSEQFILQALAHPEITVDVLISAYRYFFYRHKDFMARRLAMQVMDEVQKAEALPQEWGQLHPILKARLSDPPIRLYLSAYTALGLMLARWGAVQAAIEIANRIQDIDEKNEFGANVLLSILESHDEDDLIY
ncbi:MAG: hypothetical protein F6K42_06585 [Leptolyngbya sp. SIO1D8]|nr:hypothetical protein [Leptolyngbya sp. SIO1D8]